MKRYSGWRRAARGAGTVLLVSAITAALAEGALRIYAYFDPAFFFPSPGYERYRGQPGAPVYGFPLNARGFHDVEVADPKPPGTFRIAALGDSFVFGVVPYTHNFLTLLEKRLDSPARPVEILNMGIPGIGAADYVAVLSREALPLDPDLVLCFFFVGNDFVEDRTRGPISNSYLIALFRYVFRILPEVEGRTGFWQGPYREDRPTFSYSAFLRIQAGVSRFFRKDMPDFDRLLRRAVEHLDRMSAMARSRGIPFVVVIVPDELQIDETVQRDVLRELGGASREDFDFSKPNERLGKEMEERDILYVDLLPVFREGSRDERLYKLSDTHWNLAGNRLAARALEPVVRPLIGDGSRDGPTDGSAAGAASP